MKRLFAIAAAALVAVVPFTASADPSFWRFEWPETDFTNTSVENWVEVLSGGPPKDGIPALTDPAFIQAQDAIFLDDREPVITVVIEGEARAYPLRYLTWHEIVNDRFGDVPVAVTFCPLCNSAMVFDRRVGAQELEFGVSGKLRNSDMIMYDRQTFSWWQQAIGQGIVGDLNGVTLTQLPSWMESWEQFKAAHPDGRVMNEPPWPRSYGQNPYVGYDSAHRPFLYSGAPPPHEIPALMRVVRVGDRAWTMARLAAEQDIREAGVVLTWAGEQASALDGAVIATSRLVGSIRVRDADGNDLPHDVMFAFAFHAFFPNGEWMLPN